jgi:hypothetical protein
MSDSDFTRALKIVLDSNRICTNADPLAGACHIDKDSKIGLCLQDLDQTVYVFEGEYMVLTSASTHRYISTPIVMNCISVIATSQSSDNCLMRLGSLY